MENDLFSLQNYEHASLFQGIVYPWEALQALREYISSYQGTLIDPSSYPHVFFKNPESIFVGTGVVIEPGAFIQGPCILGDFTQVRHGAYLRGFVICGKKCILGHGSEIKDSILLEGANAAHFNYVGNSILGNRVNLGAGVKCANYRLDGKEVRVLWGQEKVSTGMVKLGAIIGDGASLGCNCVLSPGTLVEKGTSCLPLTHVHGCISKNPLLR